MKKIKRVLLTILLVLGFVMQSEMFQIECITFRTGYYLSSSFSYQTEEERIELINELTAVAKINNVEVFTTTVETIDMIDNRLTVYGNEVVYEDISSNYGIEERTYESLLSGDITVEYREFSELCSYENRYINYISYIGEKQDIYNVYNVMAERFDLDYPYYMGSNERDMIFIVWGSIVAVIIFFTCVEIIYSKKEVVLRMLMGQDLNSYILKNVITEIVVDVVLFIIIHKVVFCYLSGEFMKNEVAVLYGMGVLISACCYFSHYIFDVKKVFANISESKGVLHITYFIKGVVTIAAMAVLITNFNVITDNTLGLTTAQIIDKCSEYSFVSVKDEAISFYYNDVNARFSEQEKYLEELFFNYYDEVKPLICTPMLEENGKKYICVNEHATGLIEDFIADVDTLDADAIIFIPKQYAQDEVYENAKLCLTELINNPDECRIKKVYYSNKFLTHFDMNAVYGLNTTFEPIVIYSIDAKENMVIPTTQSILYSISDEVILKLEEKYQMKENGYKLVKTDLETYLNYNSSTVKKIIVFCSSICSMMLIMQLFLITTINVMEYQRNAMELAVKKVFGYGIVERHKKMLFNIVLQYLFAIIIWSIAGTVLGEFRIAVCVGVGVCMMILDICIALINVVKVEKHNIHNVLKGGSLW